jgi:hypothetical protein
MRQPVIANAFEKPCRKIVRPAIPGMVAMLVCVPSNVSSE